MVVRAVIHDFETGGAAQDLSRLIFTHCTRKLRVNRFAVGAKDRHAHARRADAQISVGEDFLGLERQFALFNVVAVLTNIRIVREEVKGDGVLKLFGCYGFVLERTSRLQLQLVQSLPHPHPKPLDTSPRLRALVQRRGEGELRPSAR